ncbi:hypothetical protein AB0G83_32170 [Streptomyces klenkii]|uniref:terpene synthase family protein n=1 Tax=Streptomyces klenkii TaxID=1420899 RepID=UPI0033CC3C1F
MHALQDISAALVGWCNDIVSYNKEAFREQHFGFPGIQNLVPVLAHERGCSMDEAARQAVVMHDTAMHRMAELSEQVRRQAGPGLSRYVEGLCQWVRGSLEWHLTTDRYADPNNPGEPVADRVAMPTVVDCSTATAALGPLEVPAVAWWWDC